MKKVIPLFLLGLVLSSFTIFGENVFDFHHLFGRCSGSNAYCSACSNCSACKNCAVYGGSCAVCYTPRTIRKVARPSRSYMNKSALRPSSNYNKPKPTQNIKSSSQYSTQPSRISNSQPDLEYSKKGIYSFKISTETTEIIDEEQASISDSIKQFDFNVEIPTNAEFVMVTALTANLRASESVKSQIKQKVNHGDLLIKLEISGDWIKVQTLDSGIVGYIFMDLVQ